MPENISARNSKILIAIQRLDSSRPASAAGRTHFKAALAAPSASDIAITMHEATRIEDELESGWKELESVAHLEPPLSAELEQAWNEFLNGVEDLGGFIRETGLEDLAERLARGPMRDGIKGWQVAGGALNPYAPLSGLLMFSVSAIPTLIDAGPKVYASLKEKLIAQRENEDGPRGGGEQESDGDNENGSQSGEADAGSYGPGGGGGGSPGGGGAGPGGGSPEPDEDDIDEDDVEDNFPDVLEIEQELEELEDVVADFADRVNEMESQLLELGATPEQIEAWKQMLNKATGMREQVEAIPREAVAGGS